MRFNNKSVQLIEEKVVVGLTPDGSIALKLLRE